MASASAPHGRLTCGDAFARKRPPRRLKATRSQADYEFARQSLAAAVARAYFSTIEAAQQAANAQETLDIYQEYSKLTDVRKEQGHASDFDVAQIKSRTAAAQDALYVAQAARAQTIRAIEVVTSHYPAGRLSTRDVPFPANREPCPPVCPRKSSNAGPTSSPPNAVSPPPFTA